MLGINKSSPNYTFAFGEIPSGENLITYTNQAYSFLPGAQEPTLSDYPNTQEKIINRLRYAANETPSGIYEFIGDTSKIPSFP